MKQALSCESIGTAGVNRLLAAPSEDYLTAALSFDIDYRQPHLEALSFGSPVPHLNPLVPTMFLSPIVCARPTDAR